MAGKKKESSNKKMRLLVTGGSGFIGSNFIRYISKHHPGYLITNLDLLTYAVDPLNMAGLECLSNYESYEGDICNAEIVDPLVADCDAVVHFAAESHVDRSITGPGEFVRTNVVGTQVLLDACVKYNRRFHHISTDEVFGSLGLSDARFTEESHYAPSSPYSASKASSDHLVRAYHRTYGLPITITNCSNNYGPWQNVEKFIPRMISRAIENAKLPIYGNGENVRDWVHVEDHCAAIDLVLHQGALGETYLVGGNAEVDNLTLAKKILALMGKDESLLEFVSDRLGHDLRYAIDSTKIEQSLGWERKYSFDVGLQKTVQWYLERFSQMSLFPGAFLP